MDRKTFFEKFDLIADTPDAVVDELEQQLAASRATGEKLLAALLAEHTTR
jgi:hypothetical protein